MYISKNLDMKSITMYIYITMNYMKLLLIRISGKTINALFHRQNISLILYMSHLRFYKSLYIINYLSNN